MVWSIEGAVTLSVISQVVTSGWTDLCMPLFFKHKDNWSRRPLSMKLLTANYLGGLCWLSSRAIFF
jgi:hypothetical protein